MGSVRLAKIVSTIPQCDTLADVGCDHGYIGIEALNTGRVNSVTFVDISQPSLDKARQNCPNTLTKSVKYLCQDGLKQLVVDTAVIAGMGGLEIISILKEAETLPQKLVLQPMRNQRDVRRYLAERYEIVSDVKFFDGKFYDLIYAELSDKCEALDELQLEFGKTNLTNPSADFRNFLHKEQSKLKTILQSCNDNEVKHKLLLVEQALAAVQED